jgi:predicted O-methyltransferase YrrM
MSLDLDRIRRTKGFLEDGEGQHLYRLALTAARSGPCLEIGGYCGKSTVYLGTACRQCGQVLFSVDHHRGSEEQQPGEQYFDPALFDPIAGCVDTFRSFRDTIARAGLEDTVVPLVCRSALAARAWTTPLSLVFIDGGHSAEAVGTDYHAWSRHVTAGGFLIFHDVFSDPAKGGQAPYEVYRAAIASALFREHSFVHSLGVLRREVGTAATLK